MLLSLALVVFMLEIVLGLIVVALIIAIFFLAASFLSVKENYNQLLFSKQSQSVKYGQFTEQWLPFSSKFPYHAQNFRFIGKPIDGLCFEDDKIVFVEFKTNKSQLSDSQRRVRELIDKKKVEWLEFRVD